ncbi:MAG: radical SAM protein [Candidatus Omnitrophica bacterium]|nr:radical SAM protein [Candidatus Omnitrophota bacterium]
MIRPYFVYEITPRCTSACKYCYNVWKLPGDYPKGELSLSEIERLFDKVLSEITPNGITLAGGEPLLYPEILKVVSLLSNKGIKVAVATNGILLKRELVQSLAANGVNYFEISMNSIKRETYNYLSQNSRLDEVKNAILEVKKQRAKLSVSIIITKANLADIEKTIDLCFSFSVDVIALNRFVPGGNGLNYLPQLQIIKAELEKVLSMAEEKAKDYNMPINITIPVEPCIIEHKRYPHLNFGTCVCGREKWVIDPLGNLRTCEQNPEILGSLFDNTFYELSNLEAVNLFQRNNLKIDCDDCSQFRKCGGGCRFNRDGCNSSIIR